MTACKAADLGITPKDVMGEKFVAIIDEYLSIFDAPIKRENESLLFGSVKCSCGEPLSGALGRFDWGIVNGEGFCTNCGRPARALHRVKDENGEEVLSFTFILLYRKTRPTDFEKGMRVRYVPMHAGGDVNHRDCEDGVVSSTNDKYVFVKYDNLVMKMTTGDEPYTAKATRPEDLVKL